MKLKYKISVILLVIWGAMAALFYYGSQKIILNSYIKLEDKTVLENLNRTDIALKQSINTLESNIEDWSIWDNTYAFMKDKNNQYIKSTLALSSFQSIKIDILLFFDTDGSLHYALAVNKDRTNTVPLPDGLLAALGPKSRLVDLQKPGGFSQGLISIPTGILLIASHSIISSDKQGPVHGTLVMAK